MHKCLQIPEIFLAILNSLGEERQKYVYTNFSRDYPACKADCFALALTCKRFLEPSLDALWINVHSIRPLLTILLNVKYSDSKSLKGLHDIEITFPLLAENYKIGRFAYYARRIRDLGVSSEDMVPPICCILGTTRPSVAFRPVFPRLQLLEWSVHEPEPFSYIPLFASPSLQYLEIYPGSWSPSARDSIVHGLSTLVAFSPRLEYLYICDRDCEGEDNTRQTDSILSVLPSLTEVSIITVVSAESFRYLAKMPQLRSLSVAFYCEFEVPWMAFEPPAHPFPMLEDLSFEFGEVPEFSEFFDSLQRSLDLQHLHLMSERTPRASEFDVLVKSIQKACSPATLSSFYFHSERIFHEELPPIYTVSNASLLPFLAFRQMQFFSVAVPNASWDDTLLEAFAHSWPDLRALTLHISKRCDCNFTVGGLYPLAKHCGCLRSLTVPLSFSDVDIGSLPKRDWDKPSNRYKTQIYVGHGQEVPSDISAYFEDLFPCPTVCV